MMLVQNLRQRLNGNSIPVIFLLLLLLSCKTVQKTTGNNGHIRKNPNEIKLVEKDTFKIQDQPTIKVDTIDILFPDTKKDVYKIALVLPFRLEDIYNEDYKPSAVTEKSRDFYSGLVTALNQFDKGAQKFELFVLDSKSNAEYIASELTSELSRINPDLLVVPFGKNTLNILAGYSLIQKLPLLTFQEISDTIMESNPWIMGTVPSQKRIFTNMMHYFADSAQNKNIIIVESSVKKAGDIRNEAAAIIDTSVFKSFNTTYVDIDNWKNPPYIELMDDANNVLCFHLDDEVIINTVFPKLVSSKKEYDVFLPYKWLNIKSLDLKLVLESPVHLFSEPLPDYNDEALSDFILAFREHFRTEPGFNAINAYTILPFILQQMDKYGKYFMKEAFIHNHAAIQGRLDMRQYPGYGGFENSLLEFYKIEQYRLIKDYSFQH